MDFNLSLLFGQQQLTTPQQQQTRTPMMMMMESPSSIGGYNNINGGGGGGTPSISSTSPTTLRDLMSPLTPPQHPGGTPNPSSSATATSNSLPAIKLVDETMKSLRVAKVFNQNTESINSINFRKPGDLLISSGDDDQIIIYDCENGLIKRTLNSKKYGVDLINFTHGKNTVIHSSTKIDDTIRYLSIHDNKYISYFCGHKKKVTTLSMSPVNDLFLSGSVDQTVRIWDLRSPNCQGMMRLDAKPIASFDRQGLVFGVGIKNSVKLFDLRCFDRGPFSNFSYPRDMNSDWISLKFSPDGQYILICTNGTLSYLADAFTGKQLYTFFHQQNPERLYIDATFSPDSQYVLTGSAGNAVHVWKTDTGSKLCLLRSGHPRPVQRIAFNPQYMHLATACTNMNFWIPEVVEEDV